MSIAQIKMQQRSGVVADNALFPNTWLETCSRIPDGGGKKAALFSLR
jgi:hypothetical protein